MSGPVRDPARYLAAAVERAAVEVAQAPEGQRNATLNRAAWAMARLGAGDAAFEALRLAALEAGLGEHEARATIASGRRAGAADPRDLGGGSRPAAGRPPVRWEGKPRRLPAWAVSLHDTCHDTSECEQSANALENDASAASDTLTGAGAREREAIRWEGAQRARPGEVGPVGATYGDGLPPLMADPLVLYAARLLEAELPGEGGA